jgi:hypothetical protein
VNYDYFLNLLMLGKVEDSNTMISMCDLINKNSCRPFKNAWKAHIFADMFLEGHNSVESDDIMQFGCCKILAAEVLIRSCVRFELTP